MAVNSALARVWGSDNDGIALAPISLPLANLPTDFGPLNPAFVDIGWLTPDGPSSTPQGSRSEIRGYQGGAVVRTRVTGGGTQWAFHALEDNPLVEELSRNVKSVSTVNGIRTVHRRPGQRIVAKRAVFSRYDEDNITVRRRLVIPRLEIMVDGDGQFEGIDGRAFTGVEIGDSWEITDPGTSAATATGWTVTISGAPTGGTFSLLINGVPTAALAHNAAHTAVRDAINALSGVTGIAGVTSVAGPPIGLTFPSAVSLTLGTNALTGGTAPGVTVA